MVMERVWPTTYLYTTYLFLKNEDGYLKYFLIGFCSFIIIGIRPNYIVFCSILILSYILYLSLQKRSFKNII